MACVDIIYYVFVLYVRTYLVANIVELVARTERERGKSIFVNHFSCTFVNGIYISIFQFQGENGCCYLELVSLSAILLYLKSCIVEQVVGTECIEMA